MMGGDGLRKATEISLLSANWLAYRIEPFFKVLYKGENDRIAHECIFDCRSLTVSAEDVAKRLIDYGFHAPTLSFPVAGTVMIEPTESESKEELDRFCDSMLNIKKEILEIIEGNASEEDNVLKNAPHTSEVH